MSIKELKQYELINDKNNDKILYSRISNLEEIQELDYALTFEGLVITYDNINAMFNWLQTLSPIKQKKFYLIKGSIFNQLFDLTEDPYDNDLNIICIDLNDIENINAVAVPRFQVGGRWLKDIISNF